MTTETPEKIPASTPPASTPETTPEPSPVPVEEALKFPLAKLVLPAKNVRSTLPDVSDIVTTIKSVGIIEPIIATPLPDGRAELIAGHRRYFAAVELKLEFVPVRLVSADEGKRHQMALIENLQRADMNPLDIAVGIAELIERESCEQRWAAKQLGVSEGYVSQHLSLLKLPKKIQNEVKSGKLDLAYARSLVRVKDEEKQMEFLKLAGTLTSGGLQDKVDVYLQKEKEKEEKAAAAEKKKTKAATRKRLGIADDDDEEEVKPTLAQTYASQKLEPLKKTDMMEALKYYANKLDRAEADTKKAEYKGILKGLEIASGLAKFDP